MKHITIIGAGLGGLVAGALLAKAQYRVTVLEQHNIVGGCATTFKRGDFTCEVGLHEMEGVYTNPSLKTIFTQLNVYDHVAFIKAPEFFQITTKGHSFVMPHGIQAAQEALLEAFPEEHKGLKRYFTLLEHIALKMEMLRTIRWYHYLSFPITFYSLLRYKDRTVTEVFNTLFSNERLKVILNANIQYYNDTPNSLSFLLHCIAQYSYFSGGGYFIKGGSGTLSDYLAHVITSHGGEVVTKASVYACSPHHIHYTHNKKHHLLHTDVIISNASPKDTYALFNLPYHETKEIADSLLTIYIGFSKNLKAEYGKRPYSHFYYDTLSSIEEFNAMLHSPIHKRGFVFVDYSQIDSGLAPLEKSFGVVCLTDFLSEWEGLDVQNYKAKKRALETAIIKRLEHDYPNLSQHIEYIETGTAKSVQRYIKTPKGTAYGYKPTPKQFFKRPTSQSTQISNLFFVGQWVVAGGFSPSIMSGQLCADAIQTQIKKGVI